MAVPGLISMGSFAAFQVRSIMNQVTTKQHLKNQKLALGNSNDNVNIQRGKVIFTFKEQCKNLIDFFSLEVGPSNINILLTRTRDNDLQSNIIDRSLSMMA